MKRVLLEVCCGSADDVIEAYRAGADRVELNSDLFHGGLTPTAGSPRGGRAGIRLSPPGRDAGCGAHPRFDAAGAGGGKRGRVPPGH